jgi:hypothetical protein
MARYRPSTGPIRRHALNDYRATIARELKRRAGFRAGPGADHRAVAGHGAVLEQVRMEGRGRSLRAASEGDEREDSGAERYEYGYARSGEFMPAN